jgi:hypothetical protein
VKMEVGLGDLSTVVCFMFHLVDCDNVVVLGSIVFKAWYSRYPISDDKQGSRGAIWAQFY